MSLFDSIFREKSFLSADYVSPALNRAKQEGKVIPQQSRELLKEEAREIGINFSVESITIQERGTLTLVGKIPESDAEAVSLALNIAPKVIIEKLHLLDDKGSPNIYFTDGPLSDLYGNQLPGTVNIYSDERKPDIRLSLENIRLNLRRDPEKQGPLEPAECFAYAIHEITDWYQVVNSIHDNFYRGGMSDKDRLLRHKNSKSEQLSNQIASKLTKEIFGVTFNFGE